MMFGGTALAVLVSGLISFILIRGMMASLHTALELAEKVEIGELTHRAKVNSGDELGRLIGSLNRMAEALGKTVMEVAAVSWNVSRGSEELSATAQKLAGGATEQAAAADETASAMEEMAASAQQNARQALQTDRIASKATEDARVSGNAVAQTLQVMREVAAKIGLIEEIARKTDLLALNAAIEAAPAGGIADSVHEVIELAPGDIDPGPGLGTRWRSEFIQGMAKHGEGFLLILDVNAVFSTQESAGASDLELESEG